MMRRTSTATTRIVTATEEPVAPAPHNSNGGDRLLALLQVTNAAFPTGAFTHSYGFETWIDAGDVPDAAAAEARCRDWLRFNLATCDAAAVALAYRSALRDGMAGIAEIDHRVGAIKLSREGRSASTLTGAALVAAARDIFAPPQIVAFAGMVESGACAGHHAVAYGVLGAGLGFTEQETVTSFLWSGLSSLVGVVQRLVPLGQAEAQRIIAGAGPLIERCSDIARTRELDRLSSSFAALDVASMRHERLYTRLCIS